MFTVWEFQFFTWLRRRLMSLMLRGVITRIRRKNREVFTIHSDLRRFSVQLHTGFTVGLCDFQPASQIRKVFLAKCHMACFYEVPRQ